MKLFTNRQGYFTKKTNKCQYLYLSFNPFQTDCRMFLLSVSCIYLTVPTSSGFTQTTFLIFSNKIFRSVLFSADFFIAFLSSFPNCMPDISPFRKYVCFISVYHRFKYIFLPKKSFTGKNFTPESGQTPPKMKGSLT